MGKACRRITKPLEGVWRGRVSSVRVAAHGDMDICLSQFEDEEVKGEREVVGVAVGRVIQGTLACRGGNRNPGTAAHHGSRLPPHRFGGPCLQQVAAKRPCSKFCSSGRRMGGDKRPDEAAGGGKQVASAGP